MMELVDFIEYSAMSNFSIKVPLDTNRIEGRICAFSVPMSFFTGLSVK